MGTETATLTPMLSQYWEIKRQHTDAILFYRMGDFYEMFYEDALTAAPILEVQLTSRDRSSENPVPMCGIPHHSAKLYIQRLLQNGKKVALCEQLEDPAAAKGIVKRDVVRTLTPALISDPELADENENYWLLAVSGEGEAFTFTLLDFLDAKWQKGDLTSFKELSEIIYKFRPKEILTTESFSLRNDFKRLMEFFPGLLVTLRDDYFTGTDAAEKYVFETQKISNFSHFEITTIVEKQKSLRINPTAVEALNVVGYLNSRADEGVTLFQILNHTETAMGRRLLRDWLLKPLYDRKAIQDRLDAVEELVQNPKLLSAMQSELKNVRDLERLTTKVALLLANPRDLQSIAHVLKKIPNLKALQAKSFLKTKLKALNELKKTTEHLEQALIEEAPPTWKEGGIFRPEYHEEVKELREISTKAKETIANMETREKERTGISSLKVKYSRVFGFTIEVTKSHLSKVPAEYIRKQTIANGERYITKELKTFEEKWTTSEERLKRLEESLFLKLREELKQQASTLVQNAKLLAELDVLMSLAVSATRYGYHKPEISKDWTLDIVNGRHPIVESLLAKGEFVPNSVSFSKEKAQTLLITGPNMSGKSTIMRQAALITIMTHIGSFVPADSALVPLTDAIYTRVGSSDDLSKGRSTFLVEMTEMADILQSATQNSLILIDEIGRGTSTYDGLSLAWSLVEYLHEKIGAKLLFSTHFHELTYLEKKLSALVNMNVLVEHWEGNVVFLHRLVPGVCWRSYGVDVAKLAGIPSTVLDRAKDLLGQLETQSKKMEKTKGFMSADENQMALI